MQFLFLIFIEKSFCYDWLGQKVSFTKKKKHWQEITLRDTHQQPFIRQLLIMNNWIDLYYQSSHHVRRIFFSIFCHDIFTNYALLKRSRKTYSILLWSNVSHFIGYHRGLMVSVTFHIIVICHVYLNLIALRLNSVKSVRSLNRAWKPCRSFIGFIRVKSIVFVGYLVLIETVILCSEVIFISVYKSFDSVTHFK